MTAPSQNAPYPFDPPDFEHLRFWWGLTKGQRICALLDARELAVGLVRGQLGRVYPELSERELNLQVLEELERRDKRAIPRSTFFLDILRTLEEIGAPYMLVGAFAAILYGATRTTLDIDLVIELRDEQIAALSAAYPPPRYYADAEQMRDSIRLGVLFNIIDSQRGEKADLIPLGQTVRQQLEFSRRVRQTVTIPGLSPLTVWAASPEDVIVGKLFAWAEGHSRKHETDIYEMALAALTSDAAGGSLDLAYVDVQTHLAGADAVTLWRAILAAAQAAASRQAP